MLFPILVSAKEKRVTGDSDAFGRVIRLIIVSQDRLKALDMTDIKGYFILRGGKFDKGDRLDEYGFGYTLMANTTWTNHEVNLLPNGEPYTHQFNQWIIGEYESLADAVAAMEAVIAIQNVGGEGRAYVERRGVRIE